MTDHQSQRPTLIVMGVSGCEKSMVAGIIAAQLDWDVLRASALLRLGETTKAGSRRSHPPAATRRATWIRRDPARCRVARPTDQQMDQPGHPSARAPHRAVRVNACRIERRDPGAHPRRHRRHPTSCSTASSAVQDRARSDHLALPAGQPPHRGDLHTLNPHVIVTAVTRTRDSVTHSSYLPRLLAMANTTHLQSVDKLGSLNLSSTGPKLVAVALGMNASGLVRYCTVNVDHDRLTRTTR